MSSTAIKQMGESTSPEEASRIKSEKHEEIARLAYSYWEAAGYPSGSAEQDWLRAESDLDRGQSDAGAHGSVPAPYFAVPH